MSRSKREMREYTREELEQVVDNLILLGLYPPKPDQGMVTYRICGVYVSIAVIEQCIEERLERMAGG